MHPTIHEIRAETETWLRKRNQEPLQIVRRIRFSKADRLSQYPCEALRLAGFYSFERARQKILHSPGYCHNNVIGDCLQKESRQIWQPFELRNKCGDSAGTFSSFQVDIYLAPYRYFE
ncbi:hypothetical protein TNIN_64201 [Trichonephila inaurata madagascariensis]|uniref:Uncharacterized protein n=1 Tax=Trichonephila inaurata madagascariensis TaxID=2747483 RepID=A0A8X6XUC8_9ARAC|nr:hypothetical protein TNIN_64201 [Trichonephila inaurata madagascariensis]